MELQQLNQLMIRSMKEIREITNDLEQLATKKADAEQTYQMELAKTTHKLKDDNSVTLIKSLADGEVAHLKREKNLAEDIYKARLKKLEALQSELSALQSIYRHQNDM